MAIAMFIVTDYEFDFNLLGEKTCISHEEPTCPFCQGFLKCRDHRHRVLRREGGLKEWIIIRRMYCKHCRRLHTELSACLSPYKHYESEVIEGVVDGMITPDDLESEDYPCSKTMERWKLWIEHNRNHIEATVRRVGYSVLDLGEDFLKSCGSILDELRERFHDSVDHWLGIINRLVYNSSDSLEPWPHCFAHAP